MKLIDRYIIRAVTTPLLLVLGVAAMLLLIEKMLRLFDFVLDAQGPVSVVWQMIANLVPHYFGIALPLGTFLGVMLAFRRLSLSSELDALSSSGLSFARLLRPVYMLICLLAACDFMLVGYIQPYANYEYNKIRFNITSGALGVKIPAGQFIDITDNLTIRLGSINKETRDAQDIFLERRGSDGRKTTITARHGAISTTPDIRTLLLKLEQGRQIIIDARGERIQAFNFDAFDLDIDLPAINVFRERGDYQHEATFTELLSLLRSSSPAESPRYDDYRAGLHWRIIHVVSYFIMPLLAIAMGVTGRRQRATIKPVAAVAIMIAYHELLDEWGKVVASEGALSPYVSMWGLFAVFTAISIYFYRGAIEQARTAKVMALQQEKAVRLAAAEAPAPVGAGGAS